MHARVSILEGPPDKIDEGVRYLREEVQPAWETDPGFKGAIVLNDRQSGKTLSVTFWEREEDMRAMEEDANRVRSKLAETTGQEIASVERYEVGLFEVPSAGPVSGVTDTVGGVTDTVRGTTDRLLGGEEKQR
jgi:heme-degrading monooxygenase HmoA